MSSLNLNELLNKINIEPYFEYKNTSIYLLNIKSVLFSIESNLSSNEYKELKNLINELNVYYQTVNIKLDQYYTEIELLFEEEKIQVNFKYIAIFQEYYKNIQDLKQKLINMIEQIKKDKEIDKKNNLYLKKDLPKYWFENLVTLYLKYGGTLPVYSYTFWKYIKEKWEIIEPKHHQQFIIYVCEDILGGIDLRNVSINFNTWIRRNIFDTQILRDFYII